MSLKASDAIEVVLTAIKLLNQKILARVVTPFQTHIYSNKFGQEHYDEISSTQWDSKFCLAPDWSINLAISLFMYLSDFTDKLTSLVAHDKKDVGRDGKNMYYSKL